MRAIEHIRKNVFRCTQAEMASIAGVTQASVSRWESGEFEPSLEELRRIRAEAQTRGLDLIDAAFFETPVSAA